MFEFYVPFSSIYIFLPHSSWEMWELLIPLDKSTLFFTSFPAWLRCTVSILNCLALLSFYHNISEDLQCWINIIGPILDHCCSELVKIKLVDATIYSWPLKSMSLNRAQWHVISWLPLLYSQWCFQHFFVFLEPLIFPSLLSLSADNLVSNFKEKMWSIIKKLCPPTFNHDRGSFCSD